jgi:hypothetical protein
MAFQKNQIYKPPTYLQPTPPPPTNTKGKKSEYLKIPKIIAGKFNFDNNKPRKTTEYVGIGYNRIPLNLLKNTLKSYWGDKVETVTNENVIDFINKHNISKNLENVKTQGEIDNFFITEKIKEQPIESSTTPQGSGNMQGDGLYDYQINKIASRLKIPNFIGCISKDEIKNMPVDMPIMRVIVNTANNNEDGKHWVALAIDTIYNKDIEYYDSFGTKMPVDMMKQIKVIVDKMKLPYMLKFKENRVQEQANDTDLCGMHALNFLKKNSLGETFKKTTNFKDSQMAKLKSKVGFGYI